MMSEECIERAALLKEIARLRNQGRIGKTEAARWAKIIQGFAAADTRPVARDTAHLQEALDLLVGERQAQIRKWGADSDNQPFEWMSILGEEHGELCEAINETFFRNQRIRKKAG